MATPMTLSIRINADGSAAVAGVRRVRGELDGLDGAARRTGSGMTGLVSSLKGLALTAAAAIGVQQLAASFLAANKSAGALRGSLETVTGSLEMATVAWERMQAFAAKTPFSLEQAVQGFIKLKAMGLDPSEAAMMSYANTASAMGKSLEQMIEAVADAATGEFERLKEFGIKASVEKDRVSLTFRGMTTEIGKNAAEIEQYLRRIGDVDFAGAIDRQAQTLGVAMSNVGDAWDQLLVELGDQGATAAITAGLQSISGALGDLGRYMADGSLAQDWAAWAMLAEDAVDLVDDLMQTWAGDTLRYVGSLIEDWGQLYLDLPTYARQAFILITSEAERMGMLILAAVDSLVVGIGQLWLSMKAFALNVWHDMAVQIGRILASVAATARDSFASMAAAMRSIPDVLVPDGMIAGVDQLAASVHGLTDAEADANIARREALAGLANEQAALDLQQAAIEETTRLQSERITATQAQEMANTEMAVTERQLAAAITGGTKERDKLARSQISLGKSSNIARAANDGLNSSLEKTGGKGGKGGGSAGKAAQELDDYNAAMRRLIDQYLPAEARALKFAEQQEILNQAVAAGADGSEHATAILAAMKEEMAETGEKATKEASAFAKAWERAVERIDDMFADMWKSLITGSGNTFDKIKDMLLNWLAEMAHALITRPLTVAISTAMLPGGASAQGVAGSLLGGGGTGISGMMSSLGSLGSGIQSIFSGAAFTGIMGGFTTAMNVIGTGGYFGSMGTLFTAAGSAFGSGAGAAAIGMLAPYALPVIAAVAGIATILSKSETEPRAAWDVGVGHAWEDNVSSYSEGLGVSFGFGGKSHGVDANEYKDAFDAMAEMADALAEFYGAAVADQVRDMINANVHVDGGNGLRWNNSTFDFDTAFDVIFTEILNMGAATGDVLAKALRDEAGDLAADAEQAAEQIANAMNAVLAYKEVSESWDTPIGKLLGVTGDLGTDIQLLQGYVDEFGSAAEASADTIARLLLTAQQVDLAARLTATSLEGMSGQAVLEFGDELAEAFGGLEKLTDAQALYYDQFIDAQEKLNQLMVEAIDSINSKLPKLRDEILALGQDVTTTVTTLATEAVSAVVAETQAKKDDLLAASTKIQWGDAVPEPSATGGMETVGLYKLMQGDEDAVTAWMAKMTDGQQVWDDYLGSIAESMTEVADAVASPVVTESITTTTTVPGDPNAAIYAALIEGIPPTREAFNDLMGSIDLTSEAGQRLYAGLLDLAPSFDLLYDAAEAFQGWIDPSTSAAAAMERLQGVFWDYIGEMPKTGAALTELYESGQLTTEQMAMLGASLEDLKTVFDPLLEAEKALADARQELALITLELEQGPEAALAERRRLELEALDETLRPMQEHIWLLEDEAEAALAAAEALAAAKDLMEDLSLRIAELQDPAGAKEMARMLELEKAIADQTPETAAEITYLYETLWGLEDAAAAAALAVEQAAERMALISRLYAAAGDDAMVTQLQRQAELAAAMTDGARALLLMIYAVEDATAAQLEADQQAEEAARAAAEASRLAEEAARDAWDAAQDAAREAFDLRREAAREEYDAIQEIVSTLQSLRDALQSAIDAIYIDTPLTRVSLRAEAQEKITQALAAARGGTLPDLEALAPYLETVSQDASAQFKTLEEYQRNAYRTRAELVELERLAEDQQTTEELMLAALQTIIDESFPSAEYVSQGNTADLIANDNDNNAALTFDIERLIAIADAINDGVLSMDADLDGVITFAEMQAALVGIATDAEIRALFDLLDVNGDGVLSALEALPLKIAQNLSGMFDMLDTNLDGLLTFDELKAGLGPLATDDQILALMDLMDVNDDGIISKLEAIRYQIVTDSNALFGRMDTDSSQMLTRTEFNATLAGKASDTKLEAIWQGLDTNHDGLLDATEALPLGIANSLSTHFDDLDSNVDGLLTYDELRAGLNGMATNAQLQTMLTILDANGDGMIDKQEAANAKLNTINAEQVTQRAMLTHLDSVRQATWATSASVTAIDTNTDSLTSQLSTIAAHLNAIKGYQYNIEYYTARDYQNTKAIAQHFTGWSYATGGIADGPLSGYGATLHGREAVIPLGDGNTVTAILQEPINRIGREAPDTAELRQALAELHAELKELRRDNQQIGANQIGELKEHNRRERKREVVPQQVEVVTP